ncbi:23S rRNA (uracil(1939)-C(5))-methyltransferase RlmD [Lachnospiraceae bacterium C1.1]|nr:23S rRNA (uracil(1939)-C(5))-methyltransferase RlmD [Lachnospiraceae bacterium C1.1]
MAERKNFKKNYEKKNDRPVNEKKYNDEKNAGRSEKRPYDKKFAGKATVGMNKAPKIKRNLNGEEKRKRTDSRCPVFSLCGACAHIDVPYEKQLSDKLGNMIKLLGKYGHVDPVVGMKNPYHYRCKVNAVLKQKYDGTIEGGNYSEHTHKIVPVEKCYIEDAIADRIIVDTQKLMTSFKMKVFNERNGYGNIRYLMVRVGKQTGEIMLIIVTRSPVMPSKNNFVKALLKIHPEITTIVQNINDRTDSMILGRRENVLYGKGYIEDKLCGRTFRISPQSFYQVNPVIAEKIYRKAIDNARISPKDTVIDAYCGTGTIGIVAAADAGRVIGVELNSDAVKDANINARINSVDNIEFYNDDAGKFMEEFYEEGGKADLVIMDPPRAGSDEKFLNILLKLQPERISYVSCNPKTLERDLGILTANKAYEVKSITPYDMFPFTDNVETVVLLSQQNPDDRIRVKVDLDELDETSAEAKATYKKITDWVQEHYGFHVTNLNIAQVKRKNGIIERDNYNKPKSEDSRQPGTTPEKEKAITEALKYFKMI